MGYLPLARSYNGSTHPSGGCYLGPSPSPAAQSKIHVIIPSFSAHLGFLMRSLIIVTAILVILLLIKPTQIALADGGFEVYISPTGQPIKTNRQLIQSFENAVCTEKAYVCNVAQNQSNNLDTKDWKIVFISTAFSLLLVFFIEWLRNPEIEIKIMTASIFDEKRDVQGNLLIPKRKLLKLHITAIKNWKFYLPIPKNIHAFSKILIEADFFPKPKYQAKWDSAPEPYDYINNVPKLEMTPLTMQPENLMIDDSGNAGVAIKHDGHDGFFLFDSDYYVNPQLNYCTSNKLRIKVTFKSSLREVIRYYTLNNPNNKLDDFELTS